MTDDRRDTPGREEQKDDSRSGSQAGGGPGASDMGAGGGSSGSGGYGKAQNQQFHQGQQSQRGRRDEDESLSRGERFDEAQGGGRGPGRVSGADDLGTDQAEHQDRGQSVAASEADR